MANSFDSQRFYMLVGRNIEEARKAKNHTLQSLAEELGVTKKTVHRYEKAEIKASIDRLIQIAHVLGTSVEQLTEGILIYDESK
ncbi:helix-turn-helix transcriptional regulator [Paenibacillus sp. CFBP 13594]|uniref:helix-turn-helix domain-containing protein n=1 Tax=Paenibacillus sp. CFBP 13594 TaxID=2774037 RepID=UPI00177BF1C4|nr:helix-turn-helix transcriptional regulator [Paenibacillus sp. CFBP 13594]MBD8836209.1 helix-turn-helix transcriptional regulator [Paenibacillus sp. CFBP 13594]